MTHCAAFADMLQSPHNMLATVTEEKGATNHSPKTEEAVVYEVGYHLLSTLQEAGVEQVVSRFREAITKTGGVFIAEGAPQKVTLAYPMAVWENGTWTKYADANFGWLKFEVSPEGIAAVEEHFKADKSVIRFLVVKTVREDTRASVRQFVMREVKRGDSIKSAPRKVASEPQEKVSEKKLDEVIEELTAD